MAVNDEEELQIDADLIALATGQPKTSAAEPVVPVADRPTVADHRMGEVVAPTVPVRDVPATDGPAARPHEVQPVRQPESAARPHEVQPVKQPEAPSRVPAMSLPPWVPKRPVEPGDPAAAVRQAAREDPVHDQWREHEADRAVAPVAPPALAGPFLGQAGIPYGPWGQDVQSAASRVGLGAPSQAMDETTMDRLVEKIIEGFVNNADRIKVQGTFGP